MALQIVYFLHIAAQYILSFLSLCPYLPRCFYQSVCVPQSSNASIMYLPSLRDKNNILIIVSHIMLIYHSCVGDLILCAIILPAITDISQHHRASGNTFRENA